MTQKTQRPRPRVRELGWLSAALLLLGGVPAHATQNMAVICTDATKEGQQIGKCASTAQRMTTAVDGTLVRNCPTATCTNASTENVWRKLSAVPLNQFVEVCTVDKPDPSAVSGGSCQTDEGTWGGMQWVPPTQVARETIPNGSFTATPSTGTAPLSLVLEWAVPSATACTASGSWSGARGSSGKQTITNLTASAIYKLDCVRVISSATTGSAKLTWVPPTANDDGTPLTNLAGYRIYHGATGTALVTTEQLADPAATSYTLSALPLGTRYFAVRSYNTAGNESVLTDVVSKNITASSTTQPVFSQSIAVTVTVAVKPNPPSNLAVE